MGSFSLVHWVVVIVILLLVFGPKRLSEVGKGLGQGIRNFKKGVEGNEGDEDGDADSGDAKSKRLKASDERPRKKLKAKRRVVEEDDEDDEADDEEEEARPRKKSKRA
ncbi:MAG: twin-arginine translocase TatA/TatE family subunit [Myxococcales bacterium]|nr:twin-arginine translocase TatA/TatE family subunit [Myxococcales bacterium]